MARNWRKTVDINPVVKSYNREADDMYVEAARVAAEIGKLLRENLPEYLDSKSSKHDEEFQLLVENMEECTQAYLEKEDGENGRDPEDVVNYWLTELYEFADNNSIWLGI